MSDLARASGPLAIEKALEMIAGARSVDEIRHVRDVAAAMAAYARTQKAGRAIAIDAGEIILRADARMGELAAQLPKIPNEGGPKRKSGPESGLVSKSAALAALGLSKQRANEQEKAARLTESERDAYVAACRKAEQPPTTAGAVALARLEPKERTKAIAKLQDVPDVRRAIAEIRRDLMRPSTVPASAPAERPAARLAWDRDEFLSDVRNQLQDWRDAWCEHDDDMSDLIRTLRLQLRLWEDS